MKIPKLEIVHGSSYCEYSVIENKLHTLYQNQEKIYAAICILLNKKQKILLNNQINKFKKCKKITMY